MEIFEFHIYINDKVADKFFHVCNTFDIKKLEIMSLDKDNNGIKVEYMTSFVRKLKNYREAFLLVNAMDEYLGKLGCLSYRKKIESPYYEHYVNLSLYLETHFESSNFELPTSKNVLKNKLIATDRELNKDRYSDFLSLHQSLGREIEMCLYDTNMTSDKEWFDAYNIGDTFVYI